MASRLRAVSTFPENRLETSVRFLYQRHNVRTYLARHDCIPCTLWLEPGQIDLYEKNPVSWVAVSLQYNCLVRMPPLRNAATSRGSAAPTRTDRGDVFLGHD